MSLPSATLPAEIQRQQPTAYIVWAALTMSSLIFLALPYLQAAQGTEPTTPAIELPGVNLMIFNAICVAIAIAIVAIRLVAFSESRLQQEGRKSLGQDESARTKATIALYRNFISTTIILLALSEAIATFGFLIATLTKDPSRTLPYVAASILLNAWNFPNFRAIAEKAGLLRPIA